ncbi:HalOD1 output domain-containing protein [Halalkalicoccus subterraneus]|uniref:HalOD1 output domain-containing protein n=1 Tax=Halalkalicoccus subterraneus TaxID=2675002 RepID=UPI000EFB20ED|nr:HalOD1 output domain-containing protein [Halalkalicoccus subterraneus]
MRPRQGGEPVHSVEYDEDEDLSFVVIETVAAVSGVPPGAIGPIGDVLDPEALCDLFGPRADGRARTGGVVSFRLEDYRVEIDAAACELLVYE